MTVNSACFLWVFAFLFYFRHANRTEENDLRVGWLFAITQTLSLILTHTFELPPIDLRRVERTDGQIVTLPLVWGSHVMHDVGRAEVITYVDRLKWKRRDAEFHFFFVRNEPITEQPHPCSDIRHTHSHTHTAQRIMRNACNILRWKEKTIWKMLFTSICNVWNGTFLWIHLYSTLTFVSAAMIESREATAEI